MLELHGVTRKVGEETYIDDISLSLSRGTLTVLLGPTLSGKTSLMRLMAGLDKPDSGDIKFDGKSVLGVPVQQRNIAMVYQQFINYPTLTVFDNIASPLVVAGIERNEIHARVAAIAELLQLQAFMQRKPAELSGGQQQRVALARALIKRADLVLLDEPLANLDYKLREELRTELPRLFADMGSVLVYATTEPTEALVLGGNTVCLHQGRAVETGSTMAVYRRPAGLAAAQLFSDPPLNTVRVVGTDNRFSFSGSTESFTLPITDKLAGEYTLGVRPHCLRMHARGDNDIRIQAAVTVTELTGSETFVHFEFDGRPWVALLHGIHQFEPSQSITLYTQPEHVMLFDSDDRRVVSASG